VTIASAFLLALWNRFDDFRDSFDMPDVLSFMPAAVFSVPGVVRSLK
jgi:hypothetical protein